MKELEFYEINSCTMFIMPVDYGGKVFSKVMEVDDEFLSPLRPVDLIKKNCSYFGVSFESRKKGTTELIGYTRKIPIVIEPANHLFFFPTTSPNRPECAWIAHEHAENFRRVGPQQTLITFSDKQSHVFQVSFGTVETQMLRTALLKSKLLQRIEGNQKKSFYLHGPKLSKASENFSDYGNDSFPKGQK
ncbi:competence protein ComK [Neobacillus mesonae]|uniref:competence protein ComK n=1 Tax=Neobacillus mesonae TaxID=1193713 RepID=UPI000B2E9BCC|nr:competence protein ComK [Neobacillus mesonae]MED4206081.1 competence protein ComK [Neobacillus mesonae]